MMLTGILLAGGKSKRMGRDKAFLQLHGKPLIFYPLEIMKQFCSEIFIVTQTSDCHSRPVLRSGAVSSRHLFLDSCFHGNDKEEIKILTDIYPDAGPMGGIFTGLQNAKNQWSLVLPCDMPFVRKELIAGLLNLATSQPSLEAVVPLSPKRQPLCALYSKDCLPLLYKKIESQQSSLISALSELECAYIQWIDLDPDDAEGLSFMNVNTPEDLEEAGGQIPWRAARKRVYC